MSNNVLCLDIETPVDINQKFVQIQLNCDKTCVCNQLPIINISFDIFR